MREMKFRVWNNLLKKYLPDDLVHIKSSGNLVFGTYYRKPDYYEDLPLLLKGDHTVEQFTGLEDKNGTEIYEGDIIQFEFWNEKYYRQIAYNSAIASYEAITVASPTSKKLRQKAKYSFSELYKISSKGFKVVGNIHENPELLEEK